MSNPSELRAWVEELLAEKRGLLAEKQDRERTIQDLQLECRRLRESVAEQLRLEADALSKLRAVSAERDSMAKRIKAAEVVLARANAADLPSAQGFFAAVAKALETPADELPF